MYIRTSLRTERCLCDITEGLFLLSNAVADLGSVVWSKLMPFPDGLSLNTFIGDFPCGRPAVMARTREREQLVPAMFAYYKPCHSRWPVYCEDYLDSLGLDPDEVFG